MTTYKYISILLTLFFLVSCSTVVDRLAQGILYPFDKVNKSHKVEDPPDGVFEKTISRKFGNVHIWYKGNSKPVTFVFFHGNGQNLESLKSIYPNFSNMGNWVVYDYPGLGKSTGEPSEDTLVKSGTAALQFAREKFPATRVVLWGWSLGSAVALQVAKDQTLDGLILTSSWTSIKAMTDGNFLGSQVSDEFLKKNAYDSLSVAPKIKVRTLLLHGEKDKIVPFEQATQLSKAFDSDLLTFIPLKDTGHNDIFGSRFLWIEVLRFMEGKEPFREGGQ